MLANLMLFGLNPTLTQGEKGNPDARCEFFQWLDDKGNKRMKTR